MARSSCACVSLRHWACSPCSSTIQTVRLLAMHALVPQVKSRVVEELFGARMHIELVPRSEGLIRFMAGKGMITNSHLDAIWVSERAKLMVVFVTILRNSRQSSLPIHSSVASKRPHDHHRCTAVYPDHGGAVVHRGQA